MKCINCEEYDTSTAPEGYGYCNRHDETTYDEATSCPPTYIELYWRQLDDELGDEDE